MNFAAAVGAVTRARTPADLFAGDDPARTFRLLSKVLHPDVAPPGQVRDATRAFARLAELWRDHRTLATGRHRYLIAGPLAVAPDGVQAGGSGPGLLPTGRSDIADLAEVYLARYEGGEAIVKVARAPGDSDLVTREAEALRRLARAGDEKFRAYVPRLVESFVHEDPATGERRAANVLEYQAGFVSLAQVERAYPDGVDPRDVAWMWRRLLVALGNAHRAGVVHGAVLPEHVLIHPELHGLTLIDWCYSTTRPEQHVPALVARYRDAYPPEVPASRPATPATDIYLASGLMLRLMGEQAHPRLRRFVDGCRALAARMRPQDAWALLKELDEVLHDLYGPRRFRPFALPA